MVLIGSKGLELEDHLRVFHKDIQDVHKDSTDSNVGFHIEFLQLDVLKADGDPKTQPVLVGEVCETSTEELDVLGKVVPKVEMDVQVYNSRKKRHIPQSDHRKRSWVWKYFDRLSNVIFRCRLCSVVLSIKACNTNNMNRHVRTKHPTVFITETGKKDEDIEVPEACYIGDYSSNIIVEEISSCGQDDKDLEDIGGLPTTSKQRRSWVWAYFNRLSSTQARCRLCNRCISHGGNATGNMNRHLRMIHHKNGDDVSWVWKVFENTEDDIYTCKICQYKCMKLSDVEKTINSILDHLKIEHGVISGDQIITATEDQELEVEELP